MQSNAEKINNNLSTTYQNYNFSKFITGLTEHIGPMSQQIGIKCIIISCIIVLSCSSLLINQLFFHYQSQFLHSSIPLQAGLISFLLLGGILLQQSCLRLGAAVKTLGFAYFIVC